MQNIKRVLELIDTIGDNLKKLDKEMLVFREGVGAVGRNGKKLTRSDAWLLSIIETSDDPLFKCDLMTASDIVEALHRVDPVMADQYRMTPASLGRAMRRLVRYMSSRASKGTVVYRLWVIRNFEKYIGWGGGTRYQEYITQMNLHGVTPSQGEIEPEHEEDEGEEEVDTPSFM